MQQRSHDRVVCFGESCPGEGEAGQPVRLVVSQPCVRQCGTDMFADRLKFLGTSSALLVVMPVIADELRTIALKKEAAIFADDPVHRPHTRHLIAPSCRRGGHYNDAHLRFLELFQ